MLDLADLQRRLDADNTLDNAPEYEAVRVVVAEVRAAREVIEALDKFGKLDWMLADNHHTDAARAAWISVMDAVATYDQVTGGGDTA